MTSVLASPPARESDPESRRASKDLPHLTLPVDTHPSTSPFPSPSSSFLPPPMPNAHEFANRLSFAAKTMKRNSGDDSGSGRSSKRNSVAGGKSPNATSTTQSQSPLPTPTTVKPESTSFPADAAAAATRTPTSKHSSLPAPTEEVPANLSSSEPKSITEQDPTTPSAIQLKHTSLSSSRPAPASPAMSRRASAAPSMTSSRYSTISTISTASGSKSRRASYAGQARRSTISRTNSQSEKKAKAAPAPIKIRDYAFPAGDIRHNGLGPDAGKSNRSSEASSRPQSGWGALRWGPGSPFGGGGKFWGGFSFGSLGLGFGSDAKAVADDKGFVPTKSDFGRNFEDEDEEQYEEDEYYDGEESGEYGVEDVPDAPLLPGLYKALYAFEPEGTAEMRLEEDQIVKIIGRGGGVGWAIAVREDGGGGDGSDGQVSQHALVPESYLEPYKLDGFNDNGDADVKAGES